MVSRPGRQQAAFTAGELGPALVARTELKYFGFGAKRAENVSIAPQGGFSNRRGLSRVGGLAADAMRLFPFTASDGSAYDLAFRPSNVAVWSATAELASLAHPFSGGQLAGVNPIQLLDTMILFHADVQTRRIKHAGPTSWSLDFAPFAAIPTHDYGGPVGGGSYTNGVSAVWTLQFIGLTDDTTAFVLTVSGQETEGIIFDATLSNVAAAIETAVDALANVASGVSVAVDGSDITITFDGAGNEGDGWAVSARVLNKADAAVVAFKTITGVAPGEPLISGDRGWPRCGVFEQQRLIVGGFKSLPGAWMASIVADYYNFDDRLDEANGAFLVVMDVPGGEALERIVPNRNLLLFTSDAEYWLADRAISKTTPPTHVQASRHGVTPGVPVVENEGAALFAHGEGNVLGELRYADVDGNFVALDISLLASHLVEDVIDMAVRRAERSTDGNQLAIVQGDGAMRHATLLREQEVTAFARVTTDGLFKAVSVNGRNELMTIVERTVDGSPARSLERFAEGELLDGAIAQDFDPATATITGLAAHEGAQVWAIADDEVHGPFTVDGNEITLPVAAAAVTVGRWKPPLVETLPPSREVGGGQVLRRKGRIHTVHLDLADTTSVALAVNGGTAKDLVLRRFGESADVPELQTGFTGIHTVRGITGFADEPTVTVTQVRPGRLTVRRIIVEAKL